MSPSPLEKFFQSATQYYVAGRYAAFAGLNPVTGNLLHHAIEMYLKGYLSKTLTLDELKDLGHNLPGIWKKFKNQANVSVFDQFDGTVRKLHEYEELRYPDSVLMFGMSSTINIRKTSLPASNGGPGRKEPIYELCLEEIDELVIKLFTVASMKRKFFTAQIQRVSAFCSNRIITLSDMRSCLLCLFYPDKLRLEMSCNSLWGFRKPRY